MRSAKVASRCFRRRCCCGAGASEAREKLELALRVTLRRLEDEVLPRRVAFWTPREVAALFEALVARVGLEAMLDHAIATWLEAGAQFEDYADFTRDAFRCTVPGCTARRNLQSHHIHFRSARGPDVAWNRTTLCAVHHHRGVHAGSLALRGRAPDGLVYSLGVGRFSSGDVKFDVG
ncbi:MAG: HNH endonuclease [Deltaproteobacteria bacterium]|nr:HNH endonuclease [Deltaproteobacteria bacterium]